MNASVSRLAFIWKSSGESKAREGERFTSKIQGLRSESRIISNPNISNEFDLLELLLTFWIFFSAAITYGSILNMLFITES